MEPKVLVADPADAVFQVYAKGKGASRRVAPGMMQGQMVS